MRHTGEICVCKGSHVRNWSLTWRTPLIVERSNPVALLTGSMVVSFLNRTAMVSTAVPEQSSANHTMKCCPKYRTPASEDCPIRFACWLARLLRCCPFNAAVRCLRESGSPSGAASAAGRRMCTWRRTCGLAFPRLGVRLPLVGSLSAEVVGT